jgi:hypothetical protein
MSNQKAQKIVRSTILLSITNPRKILYQPMMIRFSAEKELSNKKKKIPILKFHMTKRNSLTLNREN